jgi:aminopeptidase N
MEHAGAILYNQASQLLDESATQNQLLDRASTIAHETAHMWFGDLVTMKWFDDVWMTEVFANFMAAKIVNPSFPEVNHDLRFLLAHYPSAYQVDRTAGTNPIRQHLANLNEAGQLYGAIIYQKAPIVMRQLETMLGEQSFRDGLREYLKRYSFGNATWLDLVRILDARTPENVAAWSRAWVQERGRPEFTVAVSADGWYGRSGCEWRSATETPSACCRSQSAVESRRYQPPSGSSVHDTSCPAGPELATGCSRSMTPAGPISSTTSKRFRTPSLAAAHG